MHTGCTAPLGMESGLIKDSQITASTQHDARHAVTHGRLNFKARGQTFGGWSTRWSNVNQWIQVDLLGYKKITRVATQGRNRDYNQWVTKYKLLYSDDGVTFRFYHDPGQSSAKV